MDVLIRNGFLLVLLARISWGHYGEGQWNREGGHGHHKGYGDRHGYYPQFPQNQGFPTGGQNYPQGQLNNYAYQPGQQNSFYQNPNGQFGAERPNAWGNGGGVFGGLFGNMNPQQYGPFGGLFSTQGLPPQGQGQFGGSDPVQPMNTGERLEPKQESTGGQLNGDLQPSPVEQELPGDVSPSVPTEQESPFSANQESPFSSNQEQPNSYNQRPQFPEYHQPSVPTNQQRPGSNDQKRPNAANQHQQPSSSTYQQPPIPTNQKPPVSYNQRPPIVANHQPSISTNQQQPISTNQQPPISTNQQPPISTNQQPPISPTKNPEVGSPGQFSPEIDQPDQSGSIPKVAEHNTHEDKLDEVNVPSSVIPNFPDSSSHGQGSGLPTHGSKAPAPTKVTIPGDSEDADMDDAEYEDLLESLTAGTDLNTGKGETVDKTANPPKVPLPIDARVNVRPKVTP